MLGRGVETMMSQSDQNTSAGLAIARLRGACQWPGLRFVAWRACLVLAMVGMLLSGCDKKESEAARRKAESTAGASGQRPGNASTQPAGSLAVAALPKPGGALAADAACITPACHARYATAPHTHGPVKEGACDACHQADAGGHRYPLKRDADKTCTFCHTVSGTLEHQHGALQQGCLTCHRPHESNAPFLLKTDTVERLCASCHEVPLKRFAHDPFAQGRCSDCHEAHQSKNKMLLKGGEGPQQCYRCHTALETTMKTASQVHKPASEDCVTCHNPHSSDYQRELKSPLAQTCLACHKDVGKKADGATVKHTAMTSDHQCANCHTSHASNHGALLKGRMDAVCLECHDKAVKTTEGRVVADMKPVLKESKFLHGPVQAGDCSACHEAHGSSHTELLSKPFPKSFYAPFRVEDYALCFSCHQKDMVLNAKTQSLTNFRDGDRNLHFVHVNREDKGRSCRTCHAVHGSNLPRHMASSVPFEGSNWAMPIRYEATAEGGRCAPGCHESFAYSRTKPMTPTTQMNPTTRPTGGGQP